MADRSCKGFEGGRSWLDVRTQITTQVSFGPVTWNDSCSCEQTNGLLIIFGFPSFAAGSFIWIQQLNSCAQKALKFPPLVPACLDHWVQADRVLLPAPFLLIWVMYYFSIGVSTSLVVSGWWWVLLIGLSCTLIWLVLGTLICQGVPKGYRV